MGKEKYRVVQKGVAADGLHNFPALRLAPCLPCIKGDSPSHPTRNSSKSHDEEQPLPVMCFFGLISREVARGFLLELISNMKWQNTKLLQCPLSHRDHKRGFCPPITLFNFGQFWLARL